MNREFATHSLSLITHEKSYNYVHYSYIPDKRSSPDSIFYDFKWISKYCVFDTKGKIRVCPQRKGKCVLDSHMDPWKETLGPCPVWITLSHGQHYCKTSGKHEYWVWSWLRSNGEKLFCCVWQFLQNFQRFIMKKNEQAKTHGQWVQSHCWPVVEIKDLDTDPFHQGLTEWNYCTLRTLTIQAVKGDREAHQPTYLPACSPEVHQCAQSSPPDTTPSSLQLQPGNPPSALRYSVKHLNNCVKNLSFCCQSRNKSTPKQLQTASYCTFFDV